MRRFGVRGGSIDTDPSRQVRSRRIAPGQGDFAVDEDQGQALLTGAFQETFDGRILGKGHRLLGEVEALDFDAVLSSPVHVGGKIDQCLIDIGAADARAAAQGRIEDLDVFHDKTPGKVKDI